MPVLTRRRAALADLPELVRMGERFHDHAGHRVAFDAAHLRRFLAGHIPAPHGLTLVLDTSAGLAGMLLAMAFPHPLLSCRAAIELAWWIDPEHRGGRAAIGLLRDYEAWAVEMDCALVSLSSLDGLDGEQVGRVYERLGFERTEQSFMKWLAPSVEAA